MSIVDSVKTCFSKYATFEGRASRSEFWWFYLAYFLICYVPFVGWIASLGALIPCIAVAVRRLHDTNHSGWWYLCPIYNIVLLATSGTSGVNEYGVEPLD